jgi:hypothetical protein
MTNLHFLMAYVIFFVYRKLDESEAVSLLDISVQNLTFLPARLFQVSLLYMGALTVNPLISPFGNALLF